MILHTLLFSSHPIFHRPIPSLLRLEQQDGAVPHVKVDEVLRLVRDEAAKVAAHDAVPCCAFLRVELWGERMEVSRLLEN